MWPFLNLLSTCVGFSLLILGSEATFEFVDLDISNITDDFQKLEHYNFYKIILSEAAVSANKCVGKVTYNGTEVLPLNTKSTYKYVRVWKIPKSGDYNPELEQYVKPESESPSSAVTTNYEEVVEIHTFYNHNELSDRFRKREDGVYEKLEYEAVEVDICEPAGETVQIGDKKCFKVENLKTVGSIKCNGELLLDSINVFYRTLEITEDHYVVHTVPRFGLPYESKYSHHPSKEYAFKHRTYRSQATLDLNETPTNYEGVFSTCGQDCNFYDGCNERLTLIDVKEGEQYVYKNRNTFCLSVKTEEVREVKYVTVYDFTRNSNTFQIKILKKNGNEYVEHEKNLIDLDLSDLENPKPRNGMEYKHLLSTEKIESNTRTRVVDIEYRVGKIYFGQKEVMEEGEGIVNREVYSSKDGMLVQDELYTGEFRRNLFRPAKNADGTLKEPMELEAGLEDPLKVDLVDLTSHVTKYYTDSEQTLFVKSSSIAEKIGSINYNKYMTYPNRFFISRQYMVVGESEMKLHSVNRREQSLFESFVLLDYFEDDSGLFLRKSKDPVHFDVPMFYHGMATKNLNEFVSFDINNLGDYYYIGVSHKRLYSTIVGNITVHGEVIAPLDMDLSSRYVILPKSTQSVVILRDCDVTDCWFKTYKQTSRKGELEYEIQRKEPKDLDLSLVFENDKDGTKNSFTFGDFVVYKQSNLYNVRIVAELSQKIGKVKYKDNVLVENDDHVHTRMVNVSYKRTNNSSESKIQGLLRVLEVERWEKTTKLYEYELENDEFKFNEKPKSPFTLDLQPSERKNPMLNITEKGSVLSYFLNWNARDDYNLTEITISKYDEDQAEWVPSKLKENLQNFPVFIRLHKHEGDYVAVVENHAEHEKPESAEFFKVSQSAKHSGKILKFDPGTNSVQELSLFGQDAFHRRNYTSHRHAFVASVDKSENVWNWKKGRKEGRRVTRSVSTFMEFRGSEQDHEKRTLWMEKRMDERLKRRLKCEDVYGRSRSSSPEVYRELLENYRKSQEEKKKLMEQEFKLNKRSREKEVEPEGPSSIGEPPVDDQGSKVDENQSTSEVRSGSESDSGEEYGPKPLKTNPLLERTPNYGAELLPGEADAIAQYIQKGKRIPRRGEVGLTSEQIENFEKIGYVMSGSRHRAINAMRIKKETMVLTAEEEKAKALEKYQERIKRENEIINTFREMIRKKHEEEGNGEMFNE